MSRWAVYIFFLYLAPGFLCYRREKVQFEIGGNLPNVGHVVEQNNKNLGPFQLLFIFYHTKQIQNPSKFFQKKEKND